MIRLLSTSLAFAVSLAACATPPPEQQLLADVASALGGRDRIAAAKTLVLEGEGTHWNLGQDMTMDATGQTFAVTGYRRAVDLDERADARRSRRARRTSSTSRARRRRRRCFGVDGDVGV